MSDTLNQIARHVAGATVVHSSPFSTIDVPVSTDVLPAEIREKWVRPLYFGLRRREAKEFIVQNREKIDDSLISQLLASFDWRPRTVAAYLSAISHREEFIDQIGRLLLRSDVCFAGTAYCQALASFNSPRATHYLEEYLAYYLTRKDLWFDQGEAMAAIAYLDRINGTVILEKYAPAWNDFASDKPNWNLANSIERFENMMAIILELAQ